MTYGCQCWSLTNNQKEKLQVTQRKMERMMLGISRREHITNTQLRRQSKLDDVLERTQKLKWNWAGHVVRQDDSRWPKAIENFEFKNTRKKGRPRIRWKDEIQEIGGACGMWRKKATNREIWKNLGDTFVQRTVQ